MYIWQILIRLGLDGGMNSTAGHFSYAIIRFRQQKYFVRFMKKGFGLKYLPLVKLNTSLKGKLLLRVQFSGRLPRIANL